MSDMDLERPVPDSVEQEQDVIPDAEQRDRPGQHREVPLEADPADAAEQDRELGGDDDDYR
jgi:hypothetical protein